MFTGCSVAYEFVILSSSMALPRRVS